MAKYEINDPTVITRGELAELIGISRNSVRKMHDSRRPGMPPVLGNNSLGAFCYDRKAAMDFVATLPVKNTCAPKPEKRPGITFQSIFAGKYDRK